MSYQLEIVTMQTRDKMNCMDLDAAVLLQGKEMEHLGCAQEIVDLAPIAGQQIVLSDYFDFA